MPALQSDAADVSTANELADRSERPSISKSRFKPAITCSPTAAQRPSPAARTIVVPPPPLSPPMSLKSLELQPDDLGSSGAKVGEPHPDG
jgi:hypothetical protein